MYLCTHVPIRIHLVTFLHTCVCMYVYVCMCLELFLGGLWQQTLEGSQGFLASNSEEGFHEMHCPWLGRTSKASPLDLVAKFLDAASSTNMGESVRLLADWRPGTSPIATASRRSKPQWTYSVSRSHRVCYPSDLQERLQSPARWWNDRSNLWDRLLSRIQFFKSRRLSHAENSLSNIVGCSRCARWSLSHYTYHAKCKTAAWWRRGRWETMRFCMFLSSLMFDRSIHRQPNTHKICCAGSSSSV